jgi:ABC-type protease/lipase transport system fused ATPase/permease subunit
VFSFVSNLLYLAFPIYTMQVFSRVLMSQSGATLVVLTVGVLFVFLMSTVLDGLRARVLTNFGVVLDRYVSGQLFAALFETAVQRNIMGRAQALRDLDQFRQGITGPATAVLFDVPFMPIFFVALFIISPALGGLTVVGGIVLFVLAWLQDRSTRRAITKSNDEALLSYSFTESALRNSEVVRALGMTSSLGVQWGKHRAIAMERNAEVGDRTGFYSNAIKVTRMGIQVLTIALSALLIIRGELVGGLLFANMILAARALAPIERVVGSWTVLVNAGQSYGRLKRILEEYEPPAPATALPKPKGHLTVERLSFMAPGSSAWCSTTSSSRSSLGRPWAWSAPPAPASRL